MATIQVDLTVTNRMGIECGVLALLLEVRNQQGEESRPLRLQDAAPIRATSRVGKESAAQDREDPPRGHPTSEGA